ncbi:MAG: ribonucleoside triphosphate reductase, partial [Faecousia sp.]
GDANGRGFQYPIPTYSITKDFDWSDTENNRLLFEMTAKYGTPYFSNYVNSDMQPSDIRSMCCRLRLDLRELRKKSGGFFGSGESTGSVGVVTINMPRIAYLASDEADFFRRLDHLMDIAARSLKIKRDVITKLLNEGLYPYTKRYLGTFENHFSTIGLIGMNEVGLNAKWLRKDMTHPETQQFTAKVLNHMRERLSDYQEQYGDLYNLEATPAESTTYRLAKHDKQDFPDIITAAGEGETPYYTNSSHLPVGYTDDIFSALDIQDPLQTLYTSGTVFHAFLGEKLPDWKSAAALVRKIAENYRLPYYTISPTYSVCQTHGYLSGEQHTCPKCGRKTEVYSRITGYYRPVQNWNDGKAQEFRDRKVYDAGSSMSRHFRQSDDAPCTEAPPADAQPDRLLLFTTSTCPKCVMAKKFLSDAGLACDVSVVDKDPEPARQYHVQQAPTLLVLQGDKEVARVVNPSNIRAFCETHGVN